MGKARLLASLALISLPLIVVLATCDGRGKPGESCDTFYTLDYCDPGRDFQHVCQSGYACLNNPSGAPVCTATTACTADSDCPDHLGCSARELCDPTTYCATFCAAGCAAGYGCAADGVSCELRLGKSCYVTDTSGAGCGARAVCSATTRVCTLPPPCKANSDCAGGFECMLDCQVSGCIDGACRLSCTPLAPGDDPTTDTGCAPGFACNPQTFTCSSTLGGPCDPASDDGTQCGVGGACSPASQTCVPATPCGTDAECSGYGCQDGYCLLACTKNILPCAVGKTCDLVTHTCS